MTDAALLGPSKIPNRLTQAYSVPERLTPRSWIACDPARSLFPETRSAPSEPARATPGPAASATAKVIPKTLIRTPIRTGQVYGKLSAVERLVAAYYDEHPDPADPAQAVSFGTSGHRGHAR